MKTHPAPHPGVVAIVFALLFLAGLVPVTLLADTTHFPSPNQPPEEIAEYFRTHQLRVAICGALQFGSTIPLGIYAAVMTSRLRFLGVRAAGVDIAWFGGLAAAILAMFSTIAQYALARPAIANNGELARAVYDIVFASGGPGYTVPLGLLCAGIAVSSLFAGLLPRTGAWIGIAIGAVGELSWLSLIVPQALFLVPLTRFPAFIWLAWAGFRLPNKAA